MTAPKLAAWPHAPELPPVEIHRVWEIEFTPDAAIAATKLPDAAQTSHRLPEEFYLDGLLRIELDDDDAVRGFVRDHGFLFGRFGDVDHPSLTIPLTEFSGLLGGWPVVGLKESGQGDELAAARSRLLWERMAQDSALPFELMAETRLGLAWLRDLSRLAIAYHSVRLDMWLAEEWDTARFGIRRPLSSEEAFGAFVTGINAGLRTFHPFLWAPEIITDPARATSLAMGAPPVYSIIVSQIYNHIAEDVAFRTCQNEKCHRPSRIFVRQTKLDGTISESPRSTAKFCSATCKNAQKQRDRRRNRARERTKA